MFQQHGAALLITAAITVWLTACGGDSGNNSGNVASLQPLTSERNSSDVDQAATSIYQPALATSPYRPVIAECLDESLHDRVCTFGELPLIGYLHQQPDVNTILHHTVVSHPWMATRFREVLQQMPRDMLLLFRGVTGVVIGADIRPSHFNEVTAAIYLDPIDLWRTEAERATISKTPDARDAFGKELAFFDLADYVKDNDYAWDYDIPPGQSQRELNDIVYAMAPLLFHELAHANDFFPQHTHHLYTPDRYAFQAVDENEALGIYNFLDQRTPPQSEMLTALARAIYTGRTATDEQRQITALQAAEAFEQDNANDLYNYTSEFEDSAMLFEEVMTYYHFGLERVVSFVDNPGANAECEDYRIQWGQFNRAGTPRVAARARLVIEQIMNIDDASDYTAAVPAPRAIQTDVDLCDFPFLPAQ